MQDCFFLFVVRHDKDKSEFNVYIKSRSKYAALSDLIYILDLSRFTVVSISRLTAVIG